MNLKYTSKYIYLYWDPDDDFDKKLTDVKDYMKKLFGEKYDYNNSNLKVKGTTIKVMIDKVNSPGLCNWEKGKKIKVIVGKERLYKRRRNYYNSSEDTECIYFNERDLQLRVCQMEEKIYQFASEKAEKERQEAIEKKKKEFERIAEKGKLRKEIKHDLYDDYPNSGYEGILFEVMRDGKRTRNLFVRYSEDFPGLYELNFKEPNSYSSGVTMYLKHAQDVTDFIDAVFAMDVKYPD